jgi:hypothetical protein
MKFVGADLPELTDCLLVRGMSGGDRCSNVMGAYLADIGVLFEDGAALRASQICHGK